ncbi:MAG: cysteine-rich CWC family protein, partial [Gammaproteobacteria bacterium]
GMASGKGTCWCFSHRIPQEVIEKIPVEARELACVCNSCAFGRRDQARALAQMKEILSRRG